MKRSYRTLYCTVLCCTSVCRLSLFLAWSLLPWLLVWLLGTPLQWLMGKLGRGEDSRSRLSCRPSRSWGVVVMSYFRNFWYLVFNTSPHLMAVLVPVVEPLLLPRGGPNAGELWTNQR